MQSNNVYKAPNNGNGMFVSKETAMATDSSAKGKDVYSHKMCFYVLFS